MGKTRREAMAQGEGGESVGPRATIALPSFPELGRFIAGCRVVVLAATLVEAEPLLASLDAGEGASFAGITVFVARRPLPVAGAPGAGERGKGAPAPAGVAGAGADPLFVASAGRKSLEKSAGPEEKGAEISAGPTEKGPEDLLALVITGCDKTNAAHALTLVLAGLGEAPRLVLQVGVAGALPGKGVKVGDVVVATSEAYSDTGSSSPAGWLSPLELGLPIATIAGGECGGVFALDSELVGAAQRVLETGTEEESPDFFSRVVAGPCLTASRATGTRAEAEALAERWRAVAESMEGAAAAHVCALHGVPFLEVRGISNLVGDRDRGSWRLDEAARAAAGAARRILARLEELDLRPALDFFAGGSSHPERGGVAQGNESGGGVAQGNAGGGALQSDQGGGRVAQADLQPGPSSQSRVLSPKLRLAFSPCPNDTFIFHAWVNGLLPEAPPVEVRLADIDLLNRMALEGRVEVVKLSLYAFARARERYALLHCGGALGRGVGPLIVARKDSPLRPAGATKGAVLLADELSRARVALPGELTTAALLAHAFTGGLRRPVILPFDRIMPAVAAGQVDAGVIIHEGRFTFASYGLRQLVDLGEWWEATTGLPLPLGGIAVLRSLDKAVKRTVEEALRASVEYARAQPAASAEYVRSHAQEMDPAVCNAHIALYVNDFTVDYGPEGEAAVEHLLTLADHLDQAEGRSRPLFWDHGD